MRKLKVAKPLILDAAVNSPSYYRDPSVLFRGLQEHNGKVYCDDGACYMLMNFLHEKGGDSIIKDYNNNGIGVVSSYRGRNIYIFIAGVKSYVEQMT